MVASGKRLLSHLRVAFFMLRKGLVSKRKLLMDTNLMMKHGKLMRKALSSLHVFGHHRAKGCGLQEYEFSCSDSPSPVFFNGYFPCLGVPVAVDVAAMPRFQFSSSEESGEEMSECSSQVDDMAEEFIRRFYEQLRRQPLCLPAL